MGTREITVRYEEKVGLPNYSNSTFGITEIITISDAEDADYVREGATALLRYQVQAEIDRIRERNGMAAKYDQGMRYKVLRNYPQRVWVQGKGDVPVEGFKPVVVILPNGAEPDLRRFTGCTGRHESEHRGITYRHAHQLATEAATDGAEVIDCADGDLSRLEPYLNKPEPDIRREPDHDEDDGYDLERGELTSEDDDDEDDDDLVNDDQDVI
jgi:hypothetical protein